MHQNEKRKAPRLGSARIKHEQHILLSHGILPIILAVGITAGGTLLCALAAAVTLKNLGGMIALFLERGGKFDFVAIFSQLSDAHLDMHWLIPLLLWGAFAAMVVLFTCKKNRRVLRIMLTVPALLLCLIVGYTAALLFTRVNDVRFIDLLFALIPVIGSL